MGRRLNNVQNVVDEGNVEKRNHKKDMIRLVIWSVLLIFICYQVYLMVAYTIGLHGVNKDRMWLYNGLNKVMAMFSNESKETTYDYELKLASLGDVYATSNTISLLKSGSTYNFSKGVDKVKEMLTDYDLVLASLNTPIGNTSLGYSNKTTYSSPKELLQMLKDIGVTNVATATFHMYDKTDKGITNTLNALKEIDIKQTGINENAESNKPIVISKNEIKIGVISYLTKSNIKIAATKEYMINIFDEDKLKKDIEFLNTQGVDYIIAYISIPNEDDTLISSEQKNTIETLFSNGVDVVFGSGTIFVQDKVEDLFNINETEQNHVYSMYSLGDFYGIADDVENQMSAIANIKFTKTIVKDKDGNIIPDKTKTNMYVSKPTLLYTYVDKNSRTIWNLTEFLKEYENNKTKFDITQKEYNSIMNEKERLESII